MGWEVDMVDKPKVCQQVIKCPRHEVLVEVTNDDEVLAGLLVQQGIQISVDEVYWFTSLPLRAVTHTKEHCFFVVCPHFEEHELQVIWHVDIHNLHRERLPKAHGNTTEGATLPVPAVP